MITDFSIIIPTHLRDDAALRAIESCLRQDYPLSRFEVLVVANPPSEKLQKLNLQNVRYFESEKVGVNSAKNIALAHARGSVIVFLDDDCTLEDKKHLQKLNKYFQDRGLNGVGGYYASDSNANRITKSYNTMANLWLRQFVKDNETTQLLGGNSAYRKSVLKTRAFDESILYGGDEVGLNRRLNNLKFFNDLNVTHHYRGNLIHFFKCALRQGKNRQNLPKQRSVFFESLQIRPDMLLLICAYGMTGRIAALREKLLS